MNWLDVFRGCLIVNDYWITFYCILCKLVDQFVQLRLMRSGNRHGRRLPKPVRKLLLSKRRSWRQGKLAPTPASKAAFNCASYACRSAIAQFRAEQEECFLTVGPHKFFTYVSNRLNPLDCKITLETSSLSEVTCPVDICAALNSEFSSNFSTPDDSSSFSTGVQSCPASLSAVSVDFVSVRKALARLKCSAAGPDSIPAISYKALAYWLAEPLTTIYQQSLYNGTIPDTW